MSSTARAAELLTSQTKFHQDVVRRHRCEFSALPDWAIARVRDCDVWVLQLRCGHVVGPFLGSPPARIYCHRCAEGRRRGYTRTMREI